MTTSLISRFTAKSLPRSYFCRALNYYTKLDAQCRLPNDNSYNPLKSINRTFKTKRILTKQQEQSASNSWSIIAYNLSEELKIENVHKLLENFKEYYINELPSDVQNEAIMLSLKGSEMRGPLKVSNNLSPFHDFFLFREGSIVFWGVPYEQQRRILYGISNLKIDPYASELIQDEKEHLNYSLDDSIERSRMNRDNVQLCGTRNEELIKLDKFAFSHAVALSVKLGIWEAMLDRYVESVGWVTESMKNGTTLKLTKDQVFRKTGEIYELKHHINLGSDLLDLPDIYWDRPEQETIFLSATSSLNLRKRTTVINEKLNHCCELMNLLAGHMNDKHHIRLEWMIIVLIMVEVLFEVVKFF